MEPKRTAPITGVLNFLEVLASGHRGPLDQITTKLHDDTVIVDSSLPPDTMLWETGIKRTNIEGKWVIVEQYEDKEHAELGHQKWVNILTEYPDYPIKDIDNWSLET
uniref:Uncharacterized protein n=1 Tax=viral metagenome TaxID=1070528 RepID=A0A6M3LDB6_9ZZZZ